MVDRIDIDALLIGSLYGELTPAEEGRLQAHLESHPGDRAALAGLTRARAVVRDSQIFKFQFEPPQAISAKLLQEAARCAPRNRLSESEKEGWFARFVRVFAAHPAMAAAAMLVLVVGVAGTLYMKKGDHFADTTYDETRQASGEDKQSAPTAATGKPTADNFRVDLQPTEEQPQQAKGNNATPAPEKMAPKKPYLEVKTAPDSAMPKELDEGDGAGAASADRSKLDQSKLGKTSDAANGEARREAQEKSAKSAAVAQDSLRAPATTATAKLADKDAAPGRVDAPRGGVAADPESAKSATKNEVAVAGHATGPTTQRGFAPTAPSQAPGTAAGSGSAAAAPSAGTVARSELERAQQQTDAATLAWAKDQQARLASFVAHSQCEAAAQTALTISLRAPGFYQTNIDGDRSLKPCIAYINRVREQDSERRNAARQRRFEESMPAPTNLDKR